MPFPVVFDVKLLAGNVLLVSADAVRSGLYAGLWG